LTCSISRLESLVFWRCGASRKPATARSERDSQHEGCATFAARIKKMFDYIISGIVSVLLLVYLGWAMFRPEKF
jgi:K+-transporting ATPase KdpF subunit